MPIASGDVVRTTTDMRYLGVNTIQNVWHWQYTGAAVISDQVAVDAVKTFVETALYSVIDVDVSILITWVNYENFNVTAGTPLPDSVPTLVTVGLDIVDELPLQVGPLMSFPTAVARSIGRKYMFGYTERTTLGGGVILPASLGLLLGGALLLIAPFIVEAGVGEMGNTNALGTVFNDWTSARVDTLHRTQRRRVPGVGV